MPHMRPCTKGGVLSYPVAGSPWSRGLVQVAGAAADTLDYLNCFC
jgi:hypothetical protein